MVLMPLFELTTMTCWLLMVGICPVAFLDSISFPVALFICIRFDGMALTVVNTLLVGLLGMILTIVFLGCWGDLF